MGKYPGEIVSRWEKVAVRKCLGEILSGGIWSGENLSSGNMSGWEYVGWENVGESLCITTRVHTQLTVTRK